MQETVKDLSAIILIPELRFICGLAFGSIVGTYYALKNYLLVEKYLAAGFISPEYVRFNTRNRLNFMLCRLVGVTLILGAVHEMLSMGFVIGEQGVEACGEYLLGRNSDDIANY